MLRDAVGVIRIKHSDSLEKTVIKIRDFFFFFLLFFLRQLLFISWSTPGLMTGLFHNVGQKFPGSFTCYLASDMSV